VEHDGLLDTTNASDLVTVSWNRFVNHDKLMLIGSSDTAAADRNKLRVTLHHNLFANIGQRAPHRHLVDVVDAYNAANDPDLLDTVGWTPPLFPEIDPTKKVPEIVRKGAGPFRT
jgi:pectate lyase